MKIQLEKVSLSSSERCGGNEGFSGNYLMWVGFRRHYKLLKVVKGFGIPFIVC